MANTDSKNEYVPNAETPRRRYKSGVESAVTKRITTFALTTESTPLAMLRFTGSPRGRDRPGRDLPSPQLDRRSTHSQYLERGHQHGLIIRGLNPNRGRAEAM